MMYTDQKIYEIPSKIVIKLLHDHDEFISEHIFLKGIQTYVDVIENLANVWFLVENIQLS